MLYYKINKHLLRLGGVRWLTTIYIELFKCAQHKNKINTFYSNRTLKKKGSIAPV